MTYSEGMNGGKRSKSQQDGANSEEQSLRRMGFTVRALGRKVGTEAGEWHDQALFFGVRSLALMLGMD